MSFINLTTVTIHRRNEMETRIKSFLNKCDIAMGDIARMKLEVKDYLLQLNCEPTELKQRFLKCMRQLDEYDYVITDFNLALESFDKNVSIQDVPVQDTPVGNLVSAIDEQTPNLIDILSETVASTSPVCAKRCLGKEPQNERVPERDQLLINFSSRSSSSNNVPDVNNSNVNKEQPEMKEDTASNVVQKSSPSKTLRECKLPAQTELQVDTRYPAIIISIDGPNFWVIIKDKFDAYKYMNELSNYCKNNPENMTIEEVTKVTYCMYYDNETDHFYRGLFLRDIVDNSEEGEQSMQIFLVDTGELRTANINEIYQLPPQFYILPPLARLCHLEGIDLVDYDNVNLLEKQEELMKEHEGTCSIMIDDDSSESLGVYVFTSTGKCLNELLKEGLTTPRKKSTVATEATEATPLQEDNLDKELDITKCPEYDDPVEAVTGYSNRDEADICKHYKGGPEKTCFKGSRCKKRHVVKHSEGWTLDRVEVPVRCETLPLWPPGTWLTVYVTYVCHFNKLFVQIVNDTTTEEPHTFGVMTPPNTLFSLIRDMNSPAARVAYKPLKIVPAPGEMVAALYPLDDMWYRARVLSCSRVDQNVEVIFVDYGNVMWVSEEKVRELPSRYMSLPLQAVRCTLAGVRARGRDSQRWAAARRELAALAQDRTFSAQVIARDYDELTVALFDSDGNDVAEQLAARNLIELKKYKVEDDKGVTKKLVVP